MNIAISSPEIGLSNTFPATAVRIPTVVSPEAREVPRPDSWEVLGKTNCLFGSIGIVRFLLAIIWAALLAGTTAVGAESSGENWTDPSYVPPAPKQVEKSKPNAFRILYVGNSITRHGFGESTIKNLGWDHEAGMAASSEDKDYAHLLADMIQKVLPERRVELYFDSVNRIRNPQSEGETLIGKKYPHPNLVIIQAGEHEGPGKKSEEISKSYRHNILEPYLKLSPRPLIICAGIWHPGNRNKYVGWIRDIDRIYSETCQECDIPYVSVEQIANDPSCHGTGSSGGVRWHPNDKGMAGYARLLFASFKKAYHQKSVGEND